MWCVVFHHPYYESFGSARGEYRQDLKIPNVRQCLEKCKAMVEVDTSQKTERSFVKIESGNEKMDTSLRTKINEKYIKHNSHQIVKMRKVGDVRYLNKTHMVLESMCEFLTNMQKFAFESDSRCFTSESFPVVP